jgi:hypothetical protein
MNDENPTKKKGERDAEHHVTVSDCFIAGPDDAMGWVKGTVCRRD